MKNSVPVLLLFFLFLSANITSGCSAFPGVQDARRNALEAETKANLHMFQIAVERYAADHDGIYPESTELLKEDEQYLEEFGWMANAWTKLPMQDIQFSDGPSEGDFTYIPIMVEGEYRYYYLLAYGNEQSEGGDLDGDGDEDHVILILGHGNEVTVGDTTCDIPSLESLL